MKWELLTTVKAVEFAPAGNKYTVADTRPNAGDNYYRLKQVNKDGSFKNYGTITLNNRLSLTKFAVSIYPNPAVGIFNITLFVKEPVKACVEILDIAGRTILSDVINARTGLNLISKSIQNLSSGSYLARVATEREQITKGLVIN